MTFQIEQLALLPDELAVVFTDGVEMYVALAMLRRACPCATCQGEPDALGRVVKPKVEWREDSFQLTKYQIIGSYALQCTWGDGHATGLYSFEYLRKLGLMAESE